jgi:hypothetical protein
VRLAYCGPITSMALGVERVTTRHARGATMGLKSKMASWVILQSVSRVLKNLHIQTPARREIVNGVKTMLSAKNEPVFLGGVISAGVAFAGAYGLDLTAEQVSVTVSTVIAVVAFVTRQRVTPTHKKHEP